jgi:predicted metal-dependent enzyme (double-stranded beta helix superfamily)
VTRPSAIEDMVRRLDAAIQLRDDAVCCRQVKEVLIDVVAHGDRFIEPAYLTPAPERYARRLLHRDREGRYTVLVMVWDRGQGTALHDHAGTWCVECVYQGRIRVTSYSLSGGEPEHDLVQFREERVVVAGIGEAGALIPPFEYHQLENPDDQPAVTLHVYGGEMTYCHIYEPVGEGCFRRRFRELRYTD